jgi:methylenetetrahydrofolate reductase (NADPH)
MSPTKNTENIRALVQDASLEMTGKDVEALREAAPYIPQGARINVTFLGNEDLQMRVTAAQAVTELGLVPVPHISARRLRSEDELKEFLQALADVDATKYVFAVGGDPSEPMGPYGSSLEMIQSGIFSDFGVQEVSIAGYPEGHPDISDEVLSRELKGKLDELSQQDLAARILTQFGFDTDPIATWLSTMAADNISAPVGIGVPGPAGVKRLLSYARRFGATTSAGIVKKYGFSLTSLMGSAGPDKFIGDLAEVVTAAEYQGDIGVHFYTFGGMTRTAKWLQDFKSKL